MISKEDSEVIDFLKSEFLIFVEQNFYYEDYSFLEELFELIKKNNKIKKINQGFLDKLCKYQKIGEILNNFKIKDKMSFFRTFDVQIPQIKNSLQQ